MYGMIGAVLFAALFGGWYTLTSAILRYLRTAYPEQAYDMPQTLITGEGWNSNEMKLMRRILSSHNVYAYDARMRWCRIALLGYIVACVVVGVAYVVYPVVMR